MRIIKNNSPNIYKTIAGEMLNIEGSIYHYLDGEPRPAGASDYKGYPRIEYNGIVDIIRGMSGCIFIPEYINGDEFIENITKELLVLEKSLIDQNNEDNLKLYHSLMKSHGTNLKVKSSANITQSGKLSVIRDVKQNLKREIVLGNTFFSKTRFTWNIKKLSQMITEVTTLNIESAISTHALSIVYDQDDVLVHPHNHITFDYTVHDLRADKSYIPGPVITIFKWANPLAIELNDYWRWKMNIPEHNVMPLRDIKRDVLTCEIDQLDFLPVAIEGNLHSKSVCSQCKEILYDDNYVLQGNKYIPSRKLAVPVCPLCLHSVSNRDVESEYDYLLRVKFPNSIFDIMGLRHVSDQRKDIYKEIFKNATYKEKKLADNLTIYYILIGDKYVGVANINALMYTNMLQSDELKNRKFCHVVLIE